MPCDVTTTCRGAEEAATPRASAVRTCLPFPPRSVFNRSMLMVCAIRRLMEKRPVRNGATRSLPAVGPATRNPACRLTPLPFLILFVLAAFIGAGEMNAGTNDQHLFLSFRGIVTTDLFSPAETNAILSTRAEFQVTSSNRDWEIELRYLSPKEFRGTGESCKKIPDGVRLRPIFESNSTNALLAAQVLSLLYPPPEKSPFLLCWLCLCPEPDLPVIDGSHIRRFISVPFQDNPKNRGSFYVRYLMPESNFISAFTVTNDGISFSKAGNTYRYGAPFSAGFRELQYELLATTNVAGTMVPLSAVLKRFSPRPGAVTVDDIYTRVFASLTVTLVSTSHIDALSKWPSIYMALDQRPPLLPTNVTVNYLVTNDQWQSVTNKDLQLLATITRSSNRGKVHTGKARAIFFVTLMLLPGVVYFLLKHGKVKQQS
jgi:hypothetical protein